jgi:hypothetical protein
MRAFWIEIYDYNKAEMGWVEEIIFVRGLSLDYVGDFFVLFMAIPSSS